MSKFVSVGTGSARLQDLSMNPQKLAGQCAKLKCRLNFEVDSYAEAQKQLPPKDVTLETKDATYFYFKPDILSRTITYSTDRNIPANLVTIDARRAFEIIALNKQGVKVDSLELNPEEVAAREYGDIIGQDSLTRFDKAKKKKKKKKKLPEGSEQLQPASTQQRQHPSQHPEKPAARQEKPRNQDPRQDRLPDKTGLSKRECLRTANKSQGQRKSQGPKTRKTKVNNSSYNNIDCYDHRSE